jgi:hypothetical protein
MKFLHLAGCLAIWVPNVFAFSISLRACLDRPSQASAQSSTDTFPVLYNNQYGGFGYSKKAISEYNKRVPAGAAKIKVGTGQGIASQALLGKSKVDHEKYAYEIDRGDPLMVQVCEKLGNEASDKYANITIAQVPRKFEKHYFIGEYDGLESVQIDFKGYQLDTIKSIVSDDTIPSKVQVEMVRDILLEKDPEEDSDGEDSD